MPIRPMTARTPVALDGSLLVLTEGALDDDYAVRLIRRVSGASREP